MNNLPILKESISTEQRTAFIRALEAGKSLRKAALLANIAIKHTNELLDLLNDNLIENVISKQKHTEIVTTGKALAWKVVKEIMLNKKAPASARLAAAKWTLEASGEGIGGTRQQRSKHKELHEMTVEELTQFIAAQQKLVDSRMIDVTPSAPDADEYEGLI